MTTMPLPILPRSVERKLGRLRRAVYAHLAVRGLALVALYLGAFVAVDLLVDWTWRFDRTQRALILLGVAAFLAVACYRRLLRPLARRVSDRQLCLRVEQAYPHLGQSFISAVELARLPREEHREASPALVAAVIQAGVRAAEQVDFRGAIAADFRRQVRRLAVLAAGAWLILAGLFLVPPARAVMRLWFDRNVRLQYVQWWQRTHLIPEVDDAGELVLPRGDDWQMMVQARGVVPSVVYMDVRSDGPSADRLTQELVQTGQTQFRAALRNVLEPFSFRLRGGDECTRWYSVRLVDRPAVQELHLVLHPPAYTRLPVAQMPANQSSFDVYPGSSLEIYGRASRPLSTARLGFADKPLATCDPTTRPAGSAGPPDARTFAFALAPGQLKGGVYGIMLTDRDGLASRQPLNFVLRIVPDRKPLVRARLQGITAMVTDRATVPIVCRFSDDFAVTATDVNLRVGQPEASSEAVKG